jgi:hypothetical protein
MAECGKLITCYVVWDGVALGGYNFNTFSLIRRDQCFNVQPRNQFHQPFCHLTDPIQKTRPYKQVQNICLQAHIIPQRYPAIFLFYFGHALSADY